GRADQDDRLALVLGELFERLAEILEVERTVLAGMDGNARRNRPVAVLDLAAALAHLRVELVAKDGEQPRLEVGARLEGGLLVPRLDQRLLDQVVCLVAVLRQRDREGAQRRDRL